MSFVAERAVRSHSFVLERPAGVAFDLFTPEGERAWAQGWDPHYVCPADGRTEAGMVFTTRHGAEDVITALTEAGNAHVREMDEARYRTYIESWKAAIGK